MVEVMKNINDYLISKGVITFAGINEDFVTSDSVDEIICRHDPSPVILRRYMTGARWQTFNFSYYTKSLNVISARQQLEAIQAVLFLDHFTNLFGVSEGVLVPVTAPNPVSRGEDGTTIYTSSYRLDFYKEGAS